MIYSLSNDNYRIEISSKGAEMVSLEKDRVNYLWTKTPPFWQRHAPVLFPIVGKLKGDFYVHNGNRYTLPQHGFARDSEFELVEQTNDALLFRLKENKNPNYPFEFEFFIKYSIGISGVKTTYIIENKGDQILPFSVGAHPGFICPFYEDETLEDYYFEFEDDDFLDRAMLDEGLLSGEVQSVILKEKRLYLSEKLFEDNAFVLSGFKSKSITLRSEKFSIKVSWDDCTFLGLWKQPNAPFVCIEPWWGVADDLDHNHFIYDKKGINFLEAGKKKGFWFGMKID